LQGEPDAVFREASRILADKGVDAAIGYLASHEEDIEQRVDDLVAEKQLLTERAEETEQKIRRILEPLLLKGDLHETNIEYDEARKLYETVAAKAPEWSRVRRELGVVLGELAEFQLAEPHLVAALELAEDDNQRASAANALGMFYMDQARYAEAEPLLTQFLKLVEQLHGEDHPQTATALNNLAWLLQATNRLAKAEPLMRRVLTIKEQSYGAEHPDVATSLNNLALLLQDTNRLAEAESLMRRALAIDEQSYGAEHPNVARDLYILARLLKDTSRPAEAELLIRRVLAIDQGSYGVEHPEVIRDFTRLQQLLSVTNRNAHAVPLIRHALAVEERVYGAEHPKVAIRISNLVGLLRATNRRTKAEPLMRRALEIVAAGQRDRTFARHQSISLYRHMYRNLLSEMDLSDEDKTQRVQAAMDAAGPFEPIVPEVSRLLGPATTIDEVLATLDGQYRAACRPCTSWSWISPSLCTWRHC
jgi:tetratricopeptide (TPR) repeat protein